MRVSSLGLGVVTQTEPWGLSPCQAFVNNLFGNYS